MLSCCANKYAVICSVSDFLLIYSASPLMPIIIDVCHVKCLLLLQATFSTQLLIMKF